MDTVTIIERPRITSVVRRPLVANWLTVLVITAFCGGITQRWTGTLLDGQFYASLSLYGSAVTDRAVFTSYYWTRLGVIAPLRGLTTAFGTWPGFAIYRMLLVFVLVAGIYFLLRRFTSAKTAALLTVFASLNTVIVCYFGNTYLTGAVMAGAAAVLALAIRDSTASALGAGAVLGWLMMCNPPGMLLAGTIWLVLRLLRRTAVRHFLFAVLGAVVSFSVFLLLGRFIFPRMNWFQVYLQSNARITYSDFASKSPVWLQDISLLVPVLVLVIVVGIWWSRRRNSAAQFAFAISSSSIAFMLVFNPMMGGIPLEAPMYQAMLFPATMIALTLGVASIIGERSWTLDTWICAAAGMIAVITAGFSTVMLGLTAGSLIAAALAIAAVMVLSVPRLRRSAAIPVLVCALVIAGGQLLQNARPGHIGLYFQTPYSNAFRSSSVSAKVHAAVNTEQWLLIHTHDDDQILDWVDGNWVGGDRELYMVAGMQLWGENRIGLDQHLAPSDVAELESIRPTVIAMYGPSVSRIEQFRAELPPQAHASIPTCYDFSWPNADIPIGHACLTRLTWVT